MNAVTTRNDKQLDDPPLKEVTPTGSIYVDPDSNADEVDGKTVVNDDGNVKSKSRVTDLLIKHVPFPKKLKQAKLEKKYGKFLKLLKDVSIEIPFLDAISKIPAFPNFLKSIMSQSKKLDNVIQVSTEVNVNAFMIGDMPPKLKDPGSFNIPITIRNLTMDRALCDLDASVSLMLYFMHKRLSHVNELSPTRMTLQLADHRMVYPKGILYDVDLSVGKLTVPYDFVIMDIPEDVKTAIIVGRPYLAKTSTLIDVAKGKLVMSVGEDRVEFSIHDALKSPIPSESICQLEFADNVFDDPDEAHEIDSLQSYLEGVGGGPTEIMGWEDP